MNTPSRITNIKKILKEKYADHFDSIDNIFYLDDLIRSLLHDESDEIVAKEVVEFCNSLS
jgi:hypothetical protein